MLDVRDASAALGWPEMDNRPTFYAPGAAVPFARWETTRYRRAAVGDRDAQRDLELAGRLLEQLRVQRIERERRERQLELERQRAAVERAELRLREKIRKQTAAIELAGLGSPEPPIIGSPAWCRWRDRQRVA